MDFWVFNFVGSLNILDFHGFHKHNKDRRKQLEKRKVYVRELEQEKERVFLDK